MTAPVPSIRLTIQRELLRRFNAGEVEGGDPLPYPFSIVKLGMMPDTIANKRNAVGIVAGNETKEFLHPLMECKLPVTLEWRFTVNAQDKDIYGAGDPSTAAEIMLLCVQRVALADTTLGGLVLDVVEVGNTVELDAYTDKTVAGTVQLEILYRHDQQDPRLYGGEAPEPAV